jgi:Rps23 Pro-64 3,4-dihydroxylase Tpa1-like proline 4-hydroxylase
MRDAAIASGAFGGARQGVQEGVYDAQTNIGLAELQANLLTQNFAQAQAARQAAMANQQGLMSVVPAAQQTVAANLAQTGAGQQALQQAIIDQDMAKAREKAFEEQQRLGFFGQQFAPFTGGFGAASQFTTNTAPPPSTLNTILGVGTMAGGLLGGIGSIVGGG